MYTLGSQYSDCLHVRLYSIYGGVASYIATGFITQLLPAEENRPCLKDPPRRGHALAIKIINLHFTALDQSLYSTAISCSSTKLHKKV